MTGIFILAIIVGLVLGSIVSALLDALTMRYFGTTAYDYFLAFFSSLVSA